MSKQANPAVIGGFVVGALVLIVAGVLVFGSGKFFTETRQGVMYFEGDLKGLRVGAAVAFQGVQIGAVTQIRAVLDTRNIEVRIPVIVEIVGDKLQWVGERPASGIMMQQLVERGVRAQLQSESFVTGQLFIQLDFHEDEPAKTITIDPLTQLPEIPTVPTTLQEVQTTVRKAIEKLGDLPLEEIVNRISTTMQGIDRLVNAPEILEAMRTFNAALIEAQQLVRNMNTQATGLTLSAKEALVNASRTLSSIEKFTQSTAGQMAQLTGALQETVGTARTTLESANAALKSADGIMSPNSPAGYELVKTLREISKAARSLRVLADYLERNPNSILFGKSEARPE